MTTMRFILLVFTFYVVMFVLIVPMMTITTPTPSAPDATLDPAYLRSMIRVHEQYIAGHVESY